MADSGPAVGESESKIDENWVKLDEKGFWNLFSVIECQRAHKNEKVW